jgi:hypothetical protein
MWSQEGMSAWSLTVIVLLIFPCFQTCGSYGKDSCLFCLFPWLSNGPEWCATHDQMHGFSCSVEVLCMVAMCLVFEIVINVFKLHKADRCAGWWLSVQCQIRLRARGEVHCDGGKQCVISKKEKNAQCCTGKLSLESKNGSLIHICEKCWAACFWEKSKPSGYL